MKNVRSVDTTGGAISLQDLRDVFNRHGMNYSQIVGEDTTVVSCSLEGFNDAIEELLPIFHSLLISKLPEKKTLETDVPLDVEDSERFCVECGQWEYEGVLDCKCVGYNSAIEDMRKSIDELFEVGDV